MSIAARPLKVFLLEQEAGMVTRHLRRYGDASARCKELGFSYCDAMTFIGEFPEKTGTGIYMEVESAPSDYVDDPRWPGQCERCGRTFGADEEWQLFRDAIYVNPETGQRAMLRQWQKIPGAIYDAWWMREGKKFYGRYGGHPGTMGTGLDGKSLVAVCPDGYEWCIDGRARNCTMPEDSNHNCWTRTKLSGVLDVNKSYGPTCAAGAGSIQTEHWHGFLRNGYFVD